MIRPVIRHDGDWQPSIPGQDRAFQRGNLVGLRHGAYVPRMAEPLARELYAHYMEERPDLQWARTTVASLARAEARALLLDDWLHQTGLFEGDGQIKDRVLREWRAAERLSADLRHSLGLTPRSRAAMIRDESLAVSPWATPEQRQQVARSQVAAWLGGGASGDGEAASQDARS